jgi:CelD/BcsL family acetyltransferase involved in cellulose biosynthesis
MNVHALRRQSSTGASLPAADATVTRVEIIEDMAAAEGPWRALEAGNCLMTPYQRYDFLHLWQRHVGSAAGVTPLVVVGLSAQGAPLFLWPFGRRRVAGLRMVEFLGGKHANFNMGLWRHDVAAAIGARDLTAALAHLTPHADLLALANQPLAWSGTTNPFALLPHQRGVNHGYSGALISDYDALLRARTNSPTRKKMRKKEHALAGYGAVRFAQAQSPQEVRRVLDAFFKQKSARMRSLGIRDAFAPPAVRRFIEAAASPAPGGAPLLEVCALYVDDIIVATYGGIVGGGRFSAMFNSIIKDRYAAESPGEQLLARLVRACCERHLDSFDLGIGAAHYKTLFCDDIEPLFDSYVPLSRVGRLGGSVLAGAAKAKRAIKNHHALWSLARALRRMRARLSSSKL